MLKAYPVKTLRINERIKFDDVEAGQDFYLAVSEGETFQKYLIKKTYNRKILRDTLIVLRYDDKRGYEWLDFELEYPDLDSPKKVQVTVGNECDRDVYVRVSETLDAQGFAQVIELRINETIEFDDVEAGVPDFTFIVLNETTNRYICLIPDSTNNYNIWSSHKLTFIHDSTITLFYSHYAMKYTMGYEESK